MARSHRLLARSLAVAAVLVLGALSPAACDTGASGEVADAAADVAADLGADATSDAQLDAGADATPDTAPDTAADTAPDTTSDTAADAQLDATPDTAPDTTPDTAADATPDTAADATPDTAADTATDAGPVVGPFDDLEGLAGASLRAALHDRVDGHTNLGYSGDGTAREYMFAVLDNHGGRLECIYTGRTVKAPDPNAPPIGTDTSLDPIDTTPNEDCRMPDGSPVSGGCVFNTEHSWPKSDGAANEPAEADLHHLFPTWEVANGDRASYDYGVLDPDGAPIWSENGSALGDSAAGDIVFEVRPKYRGDVARAHFYFAVRYDKPIPTPEEDTLREWNVEDPVSDEERARNEGIFAVQHNRKPFVDRPDFVDAIDDF